MSVAVAALLDLGLREPPARLHPVVAMGSWLRRVADLVPAAPRHTALARGAVAWAGGFAITTVAAAVIEHAIRGLPGPARATIRGTALWTLLSARLLLDEVRAVESALAAGLDDGRRAVARLVSRPTDDLDESEVRAAALESLAENLSDAVVAPLWWYTLGGLPAAAAYRYTNTADACWGYRDGRWAWAGWTAARADDVANLLPARLTALALRGTVPLVQVRREASRTPSPNAGWPMAALALRLDLRLAKRGVYELNPAGRQPTPDDTRAALGLVARVIALACGAAALAAAGRDRRR